MYHSLYNTLELPRNVSVPEFVLRQLDDEKDLGPLLFPSPFTTRADAVPLKLDDVRQGAYGIATSLLSPELSGGAWKKGDVVLFLTENQHDYLLAALGTMLAGGIPALLNPQYKGRELVEMMHKVSPRAIFVSEATLANAEQAAEDYAETGAKPPIYVMAEGHERSLQKLLQAPGTQRRAAGDKAIESVQIEPETDTAVFCFSSGTSGPPKVVRLSHFNLVANVIQTTVALGGRMNKPRFDDANWYDQPLGPAQDGTHEVHLSILPQFHCYGLLTALAALHTATPCVIFSRFSTEHFFEAVQKYKVTFMFVVPPMLLALATSPLVKKYDVSTIKSFASGAAKLSKELCQLVLEKQGIPVTDGYGMTEMSPLISLQTTADIKRKHLDVGRLVPNTEARVVDVASGKDVGPGETGELWLRGPQMMLGYLDNDEADAKSFVPNAQDPERFFRSGDIVSIDEQGYVKIHDRLKDIIKYNGYQVAASELEALVSACKSVLDVAVTGKVDRADATRNELPWAFVVPSDEGRQVPEEERTQGVLDYVNARVPPYKKIRGVTWMDALPKSSAGKILKRELREL